MKFTAWLTDDPGSLHVREVEVEAASEPQAYRAAKELCRGDEFVRGIFPAEEQS